MSRLRVPTDAKVAGTIGPWTIYLRPLQGLQPSLLWLPFKVMLDPATHEQKWGRPRSHYLTWGVDAQRLRRDGGAARLRAGDEKLYEAFEQFCRANYGQAWLAEQMTEDELKAERERLAAQAARMQPKHGRRRRVAKPPEDVDPFT